MQLPIWLCCCSMRFPALGHVVEYVDEIFEDRFMLELLLLGGNPALIVAWSVGLAKIVMLILACIP